MIDIRQGDCLELMKGMGENSVDAIVTDPPYCAGSVSEASRTASKGQGLRSENIKRFGWFTGDNMGTSGLVFLLRSMAFAGLRIVKPSGSLLCFCDWRMLSSIQPAIESAGWRYQNLIVWNKGAMGLGRGFRAQHELVLHFTAGKPEYYDKGSANVITEKRVHVSRRLHQTEKPIGLMRSLIRVVAPKKGVVLDPFMGGGSTGVACVSEGVGFVGIERESDYVEIARRRLDDAAWWT